MRLLVSTHSSSCATGYLLQAGPARAGSAAIFAMMLLRPPTQCYGGPSISSALSADQGSL